MGREKADRGRGGARTRRPGAPSPVSSAVLVTTYPLSGARGLQSANHKRGKGGVWLSTGQVRLMTKTIPDSGGTPVFHVGRLMRQGACSGCKEVSRNVPLWEGLGPAMVTSIIPTSWSRAPGIACTNRGGLVCSRHTGLGGWGVCVGCVCG